MFKDKIRFLLKEAVRVAKVEGLIPVEPEITVEYPPEAKYGDYSTSLPLKLSRPLKTNPLDLAEKLIQFIPHSDLCQVEVTPPGYINFRLKEKSLYDGLELILREGERFGDCKLGGGRRVLIEYVSANPTGPLHIGHGRGAVLGEMLSNVLRCAGYKVEREYYINDLGTQIDIFARSLYIRCLQCLGMEVQMPADGYFGEYLIDLAREIVSEFGDDLIRSSPEQACDKLGELGMRRMLSLIKRDLELLGIQFDSWFRESELLKDELSYVISALEQRGYIEEREGAKWFSSTLLGESKDNVLIRSTGLPTYFSTDIAYHYNKLIKRGYDIAINIWGADHQGHVSRLKKALDALGIGGERLKVILTQLVTLKRGGKDVRFSKRSGEIITLGEVVEEVGADACKFFFLSHSPDSQMEFDIELAKKRSHENPVYYIQYAYARLSGILRKAGECGYSWEGGDVGLLREDTELMLIRKLIRLPEIIEMIAESLEPHHLPYYALDLATCFHDFYERCRVISADSQLTPARLKLVMATKIVLGKALKLMGMSAPERM